MDCSSQQRSKCIDPLFPTVKCSRDGFEDFTFMFVCGVLEIRTHLIAVE